MAEPKTRWVDDIVRALEKMGGEGSLEEIYEQIQLIRTQPLPATWEGTVRYTIQNHSSDTGTYQSGNADLFYSVEGLGSGKWGLRDLSKIIPVSRDLEEIDQELPQIERREYVISRRIRDSRLTYCIKSLYSFKCQICSYSLVLPNGKNYAEAHHLKPLGQRHNGPDIPSNILCVCPNHHAALDYGAIAIQLSDLNHHPDHGLTAEFVDYHNNVIYGRNRQ